MWGALCPSRIYTLLALCLGTEKNMFTVYFVCRAEILNEYVNFDWGMDDG
jgi:hypothetical protein